MYDLRIYLSWKIIEATKLKNKISNYLPPQKRHYTVAESQEAGVAFEPQEKSPLNTQTKKRDILSLSFIIITDYKRNHFYNSITF